MKKKAISVICIVLAFLMMVTLVVSVVGSLGALAAGGQDQIDALEQQKSELQSQQASIQTTIDDLVGQQADVIDQKAAMDEKNELARQEIELINEQIDVYTGLIEDKAVELAEAEAAEQEQYELYCKRVRAMEEEGSYTYLDILFQCRSLSDVLSAIDMIGEIMDADKRIYDQYTAAREDAEEIKAEYEATLDALSDKQAEYEAEKADLEAKIAEASAMIEQLEEEINSNYDLYLEVLAQEEALESDIQSMIAELERQEAANSITSTGTYIWPLPGYSPGSAYGWRMHPIYNEMRFHAGEDIGAPSGTPILAADSGMATVIPDNGNGYGNYIMINHGGGRVTLYAHMSAFAISNGATVNQGDVIGYVGSTGNSTGPHLHFEVRVNGATTDPKQYFNFG